MTMKLKIKLLERGYQVLQDNILRGKPTYNLYTQIQRPEVATQSRPALLGICKSKIISTRCRCEVDQNPVV